MQRAASGTESDHCRCGRRGASGRGGGAYTELPVIGVPVLGKLYGADALYSTVQMPAGVPVATVAVDGAKNAGLLAVQILATAEAALQAKMREYKKKMAERVRARAAEIDKTGWKRYLAGRRE